MAAVSLLSILLAIFGVFILSCVWLVFKIFWLRPGRIERFLREQGIHCQPYAPFSGNAKDFFMEKKESESKSMEFSHRIVPRVLRFFDQMLKKHGLQVFAHKRELRRRELNKEMWTIVKHMIEEREKVMQAGGESKNDLLGLLMESNYIESQEEGVGLAIEEVIEECKLFYFAGQETTSSLLTWTKVVLAMQPSWQERAREEVLQVFQKSKTEFDCLNQLKTVTMILYEVLRLYPPVPGLLQCTREKSQMRPETILPAEAHLALSFLLTHHDPDLWGKDVEEFRLDRFVQGVSKATKNRVSFTPFGWGPRICTGQNFAMTEAKMAMAMILRHFTFELSPSYAHAPFTLATLRP